MCCIVQTRIRSTTLPFYPLQPHPHTPTSQATHNNHKIVLVLSGGWCFDQETTPNHKSSFQSQVKHCSSVQCYIRGGLATQETTKCLFIHIKGRPNIDQLPFSYLKESLLRANIFLFGHPSPSEHPSACLYKNSSSADQTCYIFMGSTWRESF